MNLILFDDSRRNHLLPFTYTRPVAALRMGIVCLHEKWAWLGADQVSFLTQDYLRTKFPVRYEALNHYVAGSIHANADFMDALRALKDGEALLLHNEIIALCSKDPLNHVGGGHFKTREYTGTLLRVQHTWDLFRYNDKALEWDFEHLTKGRKSAKPDSSTTILGDRFFMEESAQVQCSILNSAQGPIYLGEHAEVWEGAIIRGPFALCEHASVKMGAKIYGATTVGPHSRVGGEISNCVIQGYSNKGHDGFLGNSVLGEWCNLGADTNNSNLKNNYGPVKLHDYAAGGMVNTGLQFCGLMMGDHSKCGINTMFNTGTVVGVSANIYGAGFPPNFIPSFAWGGKDGFVEYRYEQAAETATRMMERRHVAFDATENAILNTVFQQTAAERN